MKRIFSLIPGPQNIDYTFNSQNLNELAEYPISDILNYFQSIENVTVLKNGGVDPYLWLLKWEKESRYFTIRFTSFDGENNSPWGGSEIEANCTKQDFLEFWLKIREKYKAVWVHDSDCIVYSVEAFINEFEFS
jgi:hypothetical protein